ncbi:MAG: hypothetical protein K940chlam5_01484 [Candidatus Anoxychlamydiales bacterium]|nr:hypothetical protein [Candidatus Anoxychlamydiales bacterium]
MKQINWKKVTPKSLAAIIRKKLQEYNIESILVGGACVAIYTKNKYQSYDLDYVIYEEISKLEKPLKELGFKKEGNFFKNKKCIYFIEFVSSPVAIGDQLIKKFQTLKTSFGSIKLLTPTDCVKDRLAAYYYWDDKQSLEQAILVACSQKINLINIKNWSTKEKQLKKYNIFIEKLKKIKGKKCSKK